MQAGVKSQFQVSLKSDNTTECYYEIFANKTSLDPERNDYEWNVKFITITSYTATLNYGTSLAKMENSKAIISDGYREILDPDKRLFISLVIDNVNNTYFDPYFWILVELIDPQNVLAIEDSDAILALDSVEASTVSEEKK